MKKQLLHSFMAMLFAAILVLVASCSHDSARLLSEVPADSDVIGVVDFRKIFMEAGCETSRDGQIVLTPEIEKSFGGRASAAKLLAAIAGNIESGRIVYTVVRRHSVMSFTISDEKRLQESLEAESAVFSEEEGFNVATFRSGEACVYSDGRGWIIDSKTPVADINEMLAQAAENNVESHSSMVEWLENGGTANLLFNFGNSIGGESTEFFGIAIEVGSDRLDSHMVIMDMDGKRRSVEGLKSIDDKFLRYIPSNAAIVLAAGLTPEVEWDKISRFVKSFGGRNAVSFYNMLSPYLKNINGTLAVGAAPMDSSDAASWQNPGIDNWKFVLLAEMAPEQTSDLIGGLTQLGRQSGFGKLINETDGGITVELAGTKILARELDGYFVLANYDVSSSGGAGSLSSAFNGKEIALVADLPSVSLMGKPDDYGMKLNLDIEGDESELDIVLTGNEVSFIKVMLGLAQ